MHEKIEISSIVKIGEKTGIVAYPLEENATEALIVFDGSDNPESANIANLKVIGEYDDNVANTEKCHPEFVKCNYYNQLEGCEAICFRFCNQRDEMRNNKKQGNFIPTKLYPECQNEVQTKNNREKEMILEEEKSAKKDKIIKLKLAELGINLSLFK